MDKSKKEPCLSSSEKEERTGAAEFSGSLMREYIKEDPLPNEAFKEHRKAILKIRHLHEDTV